MKNYYSNKDTFWKQKKNVLKKMEMNNHFGKKQVFCTLRRNGKISAK